MCILIFTICIYIYCIYIYIPWTSLNICIEWLNNFFVSFSVPTTVWKKPAEWLIQSGWLRFLSLFLLFLFLLGLLNLRVNIETFKQSLLASFRIGSHARLKPWAKHCIFSSQSLKHLLVASVLDGDAGRFSCFVVIAHHITRCNVKVHFLHSEMHDWLQGLSNWGIKKTSMNGHLLHLTRFLFK